MKAVLHHVSFFARSSWKGFCHRAFLVLAFFFYTAPNDFYHCNKHGVCWTSCGLSFPPIFIEFKCLEHLNLMFCCNKEVNKISTNAVTSALASCLCLSGHLSWSSDLNVAWLWVGSSETCEHQDTGRRTLSLQTFLCALHALACWVEAIMHGGCPVPVRLGRMSRWAPSTAFCHVIQLYGGRAPVFRWLWNRRPLEMLVNWNRRWAIHIVVLFKVFRASGF